MSTASIHNPLRRVNRHEPCPVCGKPDWCGVAGDGSVHCMRVESERPARSGGGWWHRVTLDQGDLRRSANALVHQAKRTESVALADEETRDSIYRAILAACPLSTEHSAYLDACNVPADERAGYGSLTRQRWQLSARLLRSWPRELLLSVPGLYDRADGTIGIAALDGLLVAVRDIDERVIALQVRVAGDNGKKSYFWLSSSSHEGPSCGVPAHIALRGYAEPGHTIWITEGAKKAHLASAYMDAPAIGMPGFAAVDKALAAVDSCIERLGTVCVVIALDEDADPTVANRVETARAELVGGCLARGLAVRVARWDRSRGKGIDDLCQAGHYPSIAIATAGATMPVGDQAKEAARYREIRRILWGCTTTTATTKLGLLAIYEKSGYPCEQAAVQRENTVVLMGDLGRLIGCTAKIAGRVVSELAEAGLVDREEKRTPAGRLLLALSPGRPAGATEIVAELPARAADRNKRRCPGCGSENLAKRWQCLDCGCLGEIVRGEESSVIDQHITEDSSSLAPETQVLSSGCSISSSDLDVTGAYAVLERAQREGVRVRLDGERLRVSPNVSDELAARIRVARASIISVLAAESGGLAWWKDRR